MAQETIPPVSAPSTEGGEAVCFTAGLKGAPFGAGVIHAFLAADRKAPLIVAGISMGALNTAAFQRSYKELCAARTAGGSNGCGAAEIESSRWSWYRKYLRSL